MPALDPDLLIAPLLILPFIENCFKHGASNMLDKPWINIHLSIQGDALQLNVINGKLPGRNIQSGGIGIDNVRRRLGLLYPERHHLEIIAEEESFIVNLSLKLNRLQIHEPARI